MALSDDLEHVLPADALEEAHLDAIRTFVRSHADPFDRRLADAHCTASAFVLSADGDALAFVYHRKLACWLNPGGHGEPGETAGEAVALREAQEETGLVGLALHSDAPRPFDVDVHRIPQFGDVAAHDHLDLRYVVVAPAGAVLRASPEETAGA
ncbi:MAG: NUDIX hydrolase, partial [Vicinamibacterales bacterium]